MRTVLNIFGRSPFRDFKVHMDKIAECVEALDQVFDALYAGDHTALLTAAKKVSQLEHEADVVKNSMRNHMPRSLFMPVDRRDLLDILAAQDAICDCAEDIAVLLTLRPMNVPGFMSEQLKELYDLVRGCFTKARAIIHHFDGLLEASFRGPERSATLTLIDELCHQEHLADKAQDMLLKDFFRHEDELKPAEIFLWLKVIAKVGDLANYSERMANRVRLVLAS